MGEQVGRQREGWVNHLCLEDGDRRVALCGSTIMHKIGEILGDRGVLIEDGNHFIGRKKLLGSLNQRNDLMKLGF